MKPVFRIISLALSLALLAWPAYAGSTIDTTVPAHGAAFDSDPVRQNFVKAASDIGALQNRNASPSQPSGLSLFQDWGSTAGCPTACAILMFDGTVPVQWGALNQSTHTFSPSLVGISGTSVADPSTGKLEALLPIQTVSGPNHAFVTTDLFKETRRSNAGAAMSDTFPASSATGLVNGTKIIVTNVDASASDTIAPGSGTTISGSGVVGPGRAIQYVYDLAATTWRPSLNTGTALLGPNNLSDLANIGAARNTLIPANSLALSQLPTIGAATVLGSIAGGTPAALSQLQLTSLISPATSSLSGALPAWPNTTTSFFRGDGTYQTLNFAAIGGTIADSQVSGVFTHITGLSSLASLGVTGNVSAGTLNNIIIPAPASTSTLTLGSGKTIALNNSLTLNGTDGTAMQFPSTSATIARTDAGQTFTGINTFGSANFNPSYQSANPGNAALFSQIANPSNLTVLNNAMQVSVGTPIPAGQQEGFNLSSTPTQQAIVGTARIAAGDATTHGGIGTAGYALSEVPTGAANPVAVGILGQGGMTVDNASAAGGNTLAFNSDMGAPLGVPNPGHDANFVGSFEADVNINKKTGSVEPTITNLFGIGVAGGGTSTTNQGDGFQLNALSVVTGAKWANGFRTLAGAAVNAFVAGPAGLGASQNSQHYVSQSTNGSSTVLSATFFTDPAGSWIIDPFANSAINLRDGSGVTLFSTSAGYGGSGVKVNAFATAGIVTNNSSGVLATSAFGAATNVLHGNAIFSAVDLTADVTNSLPGVNGGTGQTAYVLGDTLFSPSANTLFRLAGNTTSTKKFYRQTGTGTVSAAPAWDTIVVADVTGLGTGVATALGNNIGSAGAPVTFNGALGTPSSGAIATTLLTGALQAAQEPAHTGDVTNTAGSLALTIAANAVTNAKAAQMAANTFKGNNTGSTANAADLTVANVQGALAAAQIFIYGSVNFNAGNTDTSFPVVLPTGTTRYAVSAVRISGASGSLTTATAGLFTAAAGGGTPVVTGGSAITVSTAADNTNGNAQALGVNNTATQIYTIAGQPTLFFRVANPQGSPATATVAIQITPLL